MGDIAKKSAAYRKQLLRSRLLAGRRKATMPDISSTIVDLCTGMGAVALYRSMPEEPNTEKAIRQLGAAGVQVLLPGSFTDICWTRFTSMGQTELEDPEALRAAELIVVPALAVSSDGVRLGRGGGWYDRALHFATPGTPIWAAVRAVEVLTELPAEPHDVRVSGVITENGTVKTKTAQ